MAYNHENIIVGAADVFIGAPDAEFPTYQAGVRSKASFEAATGWEHVGLTQGGVELAYAPDFGEVEVDQWLDVAKMFKQRQSVTVNTTFVEATLDNLLFAWGQPIGTLVDGPRDAVSDNPATLEVDEAVPGLDEGDRELDITAGSLGDAPQERRLGFIGQAPGTNRERVYELERVLSVESTTFALSRSEASTIPVALRCLPNDPNGGSYGRIVERNFTPGETLTP